MNAEMDTRTSTLTLQTGLELLQRWDAAVLTGIAGLGERGLKPVMRGLTRAGDTPGWLVHSLVLFALLKIEPSVLAAMVVAAVLATVVSQIAKRIFRRSRPEKSIPGFVPLAPVPDPFSFPSGHSTVAFAVATAAMANNPVLGGVETVLAASIAGSRLYLGAHYPVDVIGGIALGVSCGFAACSLLG